MYSIKVIDLLSPTFPTMGNQTVVFNIIEANSCGKVESAIVRDIIKRFSEKWNKFGWRKDIFSSNMENGSKVLLMKVSIVQK